MFGQNFAFIKFSAWKYPVAVIRRVFPGGFCEPMHFHDFPQVWYCHAGCYLHQIGNQEHTCTKGSFITVPAGVWHGFSIPQGETADIFCIEVKYSLFLETAADEYCNAVTNLLLPGFSRELGWTFPEETCLGPESREKAAEYLSDLAILDFNASGTELVPIYEKLELLFSLPELALPARVLQKGARIAEQKLRPLVRTLVFLNEHYAQKIVAEDLLRISALCQTDFYKCFRRFTGLTFSIYLMQLRNAWATRLLVNTTYPLSKIAELCGFTDAAHMSKCFKRQNGKLLKDIRSAGRQLAEKNITTERIWDILIE